jgi:hypothetical protein
MAWDTASGQVIRTLRRQQRKSFSQLAVWCDVPGYFGLKGGQTRDKGDHASGGRAPAHLRKFGGVPLVPSAYPTAILLTQRSRVRVS